MGEGRGNENHHEVATEGYLVGDVGDGTTVLYCEVQARKVVFFAAPVFVRPIAVKLVEFLLVAFGESHVHPQYLVLCRGRFRRKHIRRKG